TRVQDCRVVSWLQPMSAATGGVEHFAGVLGSPGGAPMGISTADPWLKTALRLLGETRPLAINVGDLWREAEARAGIADDAMRVRNSIALLRADAAGLVTLVTEGPRWIGEATGKPEAFGYARLLAREGRSIVNGYLLPVFVDDETRPLIAL